MNKKESDIRSTSGEGKLSSYVATFQKNQEKNRQGLKVSDKLRKTAETYISMIPGEAEKAAEIIGIPFAVELSNLCQYIFLMSYDLACLFEEMAVTRSRWKKKLYARLVAMTLFECTNDFAFLLGKPFREQLIKIRLTNLEAHRKTIHKEIVKFNKSHNVFLKSIRNTVIGHRDHNAEMQIELIKSLKTDKIYRLGINYYAWELKLWTLLLIPILNELLARFARLPKKAK